MRSLLSSFRLLADGSPSQPLREIFSILNLPWRGDISDLNALAQKHLLRPPNHFRWEVKTSPYEHAHAQLMPLLKELGQVDAISATQKDYAAVFIHGGIVFNLRPRLKCLDELWGRGVRAKHIILVAGQRPVDLFYENEQTLLTQEFSPFPFHPAWVPPKAIPSSQLEIAHMLCDQIILNEDLRLRKVDYLIVPDILDSRTGKYRSANTADTVRAWLKTNPSLGNYLAISNNPFIIYQDIIMRNVLFQEGWLQQGAMYETVGLQADENILVAIYLDTLARWLYAELEFLNLQPGRKEQK